MGVHSDCQTIRKFQENGLKRAKLVRKGFDFLLHHVSLIALQHKEIIVKYSYFSFLGSEMIVGIIKNKKKESLENETDAET